MDRMSLLFPVLLAVICKGYPSSRSDQSGNAIGNSGLWGSWSSAIYCNYGYFATGFKFKVESPGGDDTAANSFRMICDDGNTVVADREGSWGSWSGTTSCPDGSYITGIRDKFEGSQGTFGDDTAMNSVRVLCTDGSEQTASNGGQWGSWKDWSYCPSDTSACGFRQRVEGSTSDDTALNAVQLYCCENPEEEEEGPNSYEFSDIYGYWKLISMCGGGGLCSETITISITNVETSEVTNEFETSFAAAASATIGYSSGALSPGASGSVTVELTATARNSITQSTINSISESISESKTFSCPAEDDAMYQWITVSHATVTSPSGDTSEIEFELDSIVRWCVSDSTLEPQCPVGYCVDEDCQECLPFSDDIIVDAADEGTPTPQPTPKPTSRYYQSYGDSLEDEDNENPGLIITIVVLFVSLVVVSIIIYCLYKCCMNCSKNDQQSNKGNQVMTNPTQVASTTTTAPVYPAMQPAIVHQTVLPMAQHTGHTTAGYPALTVRSVAMPYQTTSPNVIVIPSNANTVPRV